MQDDLVTIYEAGSLPEAEMLSDRLESAGVRNYVGNDDSPLDGLVAGEQTVAVMVLPQDANKARGVVEAFLAEGRK